MNEAVALKKPTCPLCKKNGIFTLKSLIPVHFFISRPPSEDPDDTIQTIIACPGCQRTITDTMRLSMSRKCGHVHCDLCWEKFVQGKQCLVCEEKCREKDRVKLDREGTGYVGGGGQIVAIKQDLAFQG